MAVLGGKKKKKINNNAKGYENRLIIGECPLLWQFFGIKSVKSRFYYLRRKSLLGSRRSGNVGILKFEGK